MATDNKLLAEVWHQKSIPVIVRKTGAVPLLIRLPFSKDNRNFLRNGNRKKQPVWKSEKPTKYWELPRSRFEELAEIILRRHGKIYIIQPYHVLEKCSPSCKHAAGFECECSCMGKYHGIDNPNGHWFHVSETRDILIEDCGYSCRLMTIDNRMAISSGVSQGS